MTPEEREAWILSLSAKERREFRYNPIFSLRDNQLVINEGDWKYWIVLAGRFFGKSYIGAAWVKQWTEAYPGEKHLGIIVAPTAADFHKVIDPAFSKIYPPEEKPVYIEGKELRFHNGATVDCFSSDVEIRGTNARFLWADEICKFNHSIQSDVEETLRVGSLSVRTGRRPRILYTTTPKNWRLFRDWEKRAEENDPLYRITRGKSSENTAIDPFVIETFIKEHSGSLFAKQELDGLIVKDNVRALWSVQGIHAQRCKADPPPFRRIVIAVDPATTDNKDSDETGISVCALGGPMLDQEDGNPTNFHGYVLEDASGKYSPEGWARKVAHLYETYRADKIVAESNQGGKMVESVMRSINPNLPIKLIHASRGKFSRAEPVAGLYGQGRVHHVGVFPELEAQMVDYDGSGSRSPDRMDALVYAITELLLTNGSSTIGGTQWLPYY